MATLVSIQVGTPATRGTPGAADPFDRPWTSGFHKAPVPGPVAVRRTNLHGDGQADLTVHGGPDKAVLCYSADHYTYWRRRLNLADFPHGAFGENLTVAGLTESDACIGDVVSVGSVRLELSQPRQPCWKLARRWRVKQLPAYVVETGFGGWYYRVLTEGEIAPGLNVVLESRPFPAWPVARANDVFYRLRGDPAANAALAAVPALALSWREMLLERA